ncbi:hypothetical protein SCLCIDRAFT_377200 [Scleroderma citrinum Foug A]|uniref:Uncharacterized protein n=1 Tax=Scleroderma citrinum Foug A TaxID=1036808 RepID=A0A0C2ZPD2_9AGAM|nr:hypothetical protein SCLCIDRAFT_377200 [Scleroderma citrinum Foug A]
MASTSLFSGIEVLYQVPPLPAFPCALHNPTSLLSNPETMEDVPPSFGHRAHPSSPLGGPSVMPWTARDPAVHLPIPMETYNPPSTVCPTSCPIGPGGSQMLWGVKSPSDQNNQRASPANACPLADETPPDDKPYTPYNRVQQRCGWRSQDGTPCGTVITYSCQGHFALAHGITQLSGQTHLLCRWCHPAHQIKREHLLRHIREVHLGFPRWKRERA